MLVRIKDIQLLDDYVLRVAFDDNKIVTYDMKEDMNLPHYNDLRTVAGLWNNCRLDESRTCVYWNDYIDLSSDTIYEFGTVL